MESIIQNLINALSLGGTYALLALGLAIVYSIMGLINFAHGELMTITGYVLVFGASSLGLPFPVAVVLGILVGAVGALLMERIAFRPLRGSNVAILLLSSFAVSLILQTLFQNVFSARPHGLEIPGWLTGTINLAGVQIGRIQLLSTVTAIGVMIALNWYLRTRLSGIAMRAAAENFAVTRLMGIKANRVIATAFALSGLLAGVAGVLWVSQRSSVDPTMGSGPVIKAFIAATIGGLGSLSGAVVGGFLLGAVEVSLQTFLPDSALPYRDALALLIVVTIPVVRPQGLLGKAAVDRA